MKNIFIIALLAISIHANAQDRYIVWLKDKNNSPFTLSNPSAYLSQRAITRRTTMGISIDSSDLPVTPSYVNSIAGTGAKILNRSRWFNTVTVEADTNEIIQVGSLGFVQSYKKVFGTNVQRMPNKKGKFDDEMKELPPVVFSKPLGSYGGADNQTKMIKADALHSAGYTGKGMVIAVIDAGFNNTHTHKAFDSLRANNQILGTWDFSNNAENVYSYANHGTSVLSCIGANVPDSMIGTAPHASFYLLRSEEEATEYIIEEYHWAAAAEYADSVGADIINSSLGYTEFDAKSHNHTYQDMDGNTTIVTRAANIASSKGVLVVNSAGNSGGDSWFFIGAPADGDAVFTIGSVDPQSVISGFSSNGPTSNGNIKPDVVAQGGPAWLARAGNGSYSFASGTSFSSPIMAGFSACAWQLLKTSKPNSTPADLKAWIKKYSDNNSSPNNQYGWGIPNGSALLNNVGIGQEKKTSILLYPNPVQDKLYINTYDDGSTVWQVSICNSIGDKIAEYELSSASLLNGIELSANISSGLYIIRLQNEQRSVQYKFIKD